MMRSPRWYVTSLRLCLTFGNALSDSSRPKKASITARVTGTGTPTRPYAASASDEKERSTTRPHSGCLVATTSAATPPPMEWPKMTMSRSVRPGVVLSRNAMTSHASSTMSDVRFVTPWLVPTPRKFTWTASAPTRRPRLAAPAMECSHSSPLPPRYSSTRGARPAVADAPAATRAAESLWFALYELGMSSSSQRPLWRWRACRPRMSTMCVMSGAGNVMRHTASCATDARCSATTAPATCPVVVSDSAHDKNSAAADAMPGSAR
mmetsp:Transcript_5410/g.17079  ORF Transcript_5410/g.17079 Transcript_5410/m.17079 type:complete len:265 (-) Transcript_5410:275-1069(-)